MPIRRRATSEGPGPPLARRPCQARNLRAEGQVGAEIRVLAQRAGPAGTERGHLAVGAGLLLGTERVAAACGLVVHQARVRGPDVPVPPLAELETEIDVV